MRWVERLFDPNTARELLMQNLGQLLQRFITEEDGPTAVEYAVMLSLIIVVCIASITTLGTNANSTFQKVGSQLRKSGS